jgi:thiamine monophosphate synthase
LGKVKFNLLTRKVSASFVALGGIKKENFNQIKNLNINGIAIQSDKKKAGKYIPAFFKKCF